MIPLILTAITAFMTLANTIIQKYGSDKHTPTLKRISKNMTIEMLAMKERRRQKRLLRGMKTIFILGALSFAGCYCKQPQPEHQYTMTGKCFFWDFIESETKGSYCGARWPGNYGVYCNRKKGHRHYHHAHFDGNCLQIWKKN